MLLFTDCLEKLSEKGSERGFDRRFGQYTNAKTARKVSFRCPVRLRCRGVRYFSDSFSRNCLINRSRSYFGVPRASIRGQTSPILPPRASRTPRSGSPPAIYQTVSEGKFSETQGKREPGLLDPGPPCYQGKTLQTKPSLAEDFTENLLGCAPHSVGDLLHTFDDRLHTVVHGFYHATEDWVDDVVGDGIHDLAYTVGSGTYDFSSPF